MTHSKRAGTWNFCHIQKSEVLTPLDFTVQHQALHELAMRLLQLVSYHHHAQQQQQQHFVGGLLLMITRYNAVVIA